MMIELLFLFVLSITTINARCTFYDHRKLREEVKAAYYGDSRCEDHPSLWNVSVRFFFFNPHSYSHFFNKIDIHRR